MRYNNYMVYVTAKSKEGNCMQLINLYCLIGLTSKHYVIVR